MKGLTPSIGDHANELKVYEIIMWTGIKQGLSLDCYWGEKNKMSEEFIF